MINDERTGYMGRGERGEGGFWISPSGIRCDIESEGGREVKETDETPSFVSKKNYIVLV